MKVLFDQNVPRGLAHHLDGHDVTRAAELGWEELKNGELLGAAERQGFSVLVSCDQNLSYQNSLAGKLIAVLSLSTNNWNLMKPHAREVASAVDAAQPGMFKRVECGAFLPRKKRNRSVKPGL